jgi:tRNA pseudouridine55 synthase
LAHKRRAGEALDGLLLVDKPSGPSSNQVLQQVRRLFQARKAGHAGTLDPFAVGLLPVLFGEATKFASYLSAAGKSYEASIVLGVKTTTGDFTGEAIERRSVQVGITHIEAALQQFRGSLLQTPPMYSALKYAGEPLYRLARRGEVVERKPRPVEITRLELMEVRDHEIDVFVECSKGTYIRTLAEDIGAALGCGGALSRLRRKRVGGFDADDALEPKVLEEMDAEQRRAVLLPVDAAVAMLHSVQLSDEESLRIAQGQPIPLLAGRVADGTVRLYCDAQGFLGLGRVEGLILSPHRLLSSPTIGIAPK